MFDIEDINKEHAETVFKFLVILCNNEDTAEELTQETFYRAVKSANRYDGTCKVSTWLCQIAKHLWYQELDKTSILKILPASYLVNPSLLHPSSIWV